jgi:N-acetylglucosaminyldiphosphoundecaprenol N-acetyl-beta-D-mannosaminyltransferase
MRSRVYIQGVPVDLFSRSEVLALVTSWLSTADRSRQIVTLNALMLIRAIRDLQFNRIIQRADLITVDGQGIMKALRKEGHQPLEQYTGIDLTRELLSWCSRYHCPVFFYGGSPAVAARLSRNLSRQWPGLSILGAWNGYEHSRQSNTIFEELAQKQPPLLLAGLGSPAQELFLARSLSQLKGTVGIGVGGALDILAGVKSEAPRCIRNHGWEWLYRMIQEPAKIKNFPDLVRFWYRCLR